MKAAYFPPLLFDHAWHLLALIGTMGATVLKTATRWHIGKGRHFTLKNHWRFVSIEGRYRLDQGTGVGVAG
jgi:hypothetical protein